MRTRTRPKTVVIKVRAPAHVAALIHETAIEDGLGDGAWLRVLAIATMKKRGKWPAGEMERRLRELVAAGRADEILGLLRGLATNPAPPPEG